MKHLVIGMIAVSSLAFSATATAVSTEVAALPGSMNEFVNWNLDRGVCGTWSDTGVTATRASRGHPPTGPSASPESKSE